jgi:hypothetical protein
MRLNARSRNFSRFAFFDNLPANTSMTIRAAESCSCDSLRRRIARRSMPNSRWMRQTNVNSWDARAISNASRSRDADSEYRSSARKARAWISHRYGETASPSV